MIRHADTSTPAAVRAVVVAVFEDLFPDTDSRFVDRAFGFFEDCFGGRYQGYQAIDTGYHDTEHTLLGAMCLANLFEGWGRAKARPHLTSHMFELGLWGILLHDSGYLKQHGDDSGGGAKYTLEHVDRSVSFCARLLAEVGYTEDDILSVQCMIRTTGLDADFAQIGFRSENDRKVGYAVCTADLLGQMSDDNYLEKLKFLHEEFSEAAAFSGTTDAGHFAYVDLDDLLERTPTFWRDYVWPRLEHDCDAMYRFLNRPYPDGGNEYLKRVEANIAAVRYATRRDPDTGPADRRSSSP